MAVLCDRLHLLYGNVRRKQFVQLVPELRTVHLTKVKVCHHHAGMHTRIGTSCPHHFDGLSQHGRKGMLQRLLHADTMRLHLPAMVGCAIVGKRNEITHKL